MNWKDIFKKTKSVSSPQFQKAQSYKKQSFFF